MKEVLSQSHLKKAHSGQLTSQSSGALLPNEMHAEITSGMSITCEEAPFTLLRVRRKYPYTELDRYSVSTLYFAVLSLSWGSFMSNETCGSFVCTWNSTGFLSSLQREKKGSLCRAKWKAADSFVAKLSAAKGKATTLSAALKYAAVLDVRTTWRRTAVHTETCFRFGSANGREAGKTIGMRRRDVTFLFLSFC